MGLHEASMILLEQTGGQGKESKPPGRETRRRDSLPVEKRISLLITQYHIAVI